MRLMAKEDDVYKLMDRRDLYLGAAGLCGIVSVVLLLFISYEFDFLRDNIRTIQNSGIYG